MMLAPMPGTRSGWFFLRSYSEMKREKRRSIEAVYKMKTRRKPQQQR